MRARDLYGREVIDAEAKILGYVTDIEVDSKKWAVSGLVIKTGFIKKKVIQIDDIDKIGDKVVLKVSVNKEQ